MGPASVSNLEPGVLKHFNACRWDAAWRLAQPCGNGGQLALMGANVTRSSLGWFFVHAPGIDEALLLINRNDNFFMNKRLQAVTDGRGQLLAIADSSGQITEAYAGSGHDQSSWQGAGLTTQAQTFNPRKWQTDDTWGGIQQFRNRAYDPATGTWIQEDPMGVAGGVNVYRFNNGNPVSFNDPFGLCPTCKAVQAGVRGGIVLGGSVGGIPGAAIGAILGGVVTGALAHHLFSESADAPKDGPTADEIISSTKKGSIRREFPGEMLGKSRSEIDAMSRAGDRVAQKARKLLTDKRFDKGTQ